MNQNNLRSFVFCLISVIPISVLAQEQTFKNGEYLTKGGRGSLTISGQKNKHFFSIYELGTNGHSCEITGGVLGNQAVLAELDYEYIGPPCEVKFIRKGDVISVLPSGSCSESYCGMRASFGGDYYKPNKGCTINEQTQRYNSFKAFYTKKKYALALKQSQSLLIDCNKFSDWMRKDALKNDIAITQFHLGEKAGCLKTLKSIEASPEYAYAPMEADMVASITEAKNTNLKLCNQLK